MSKIMVDVRNLSKRYDVAGSVKTVLKDISFKIKKGEIVCILGSSGCGKTTLLRMLVGLEKIDDGIICIDNSIYKTVSNKVIMVYQDLNQIFPWKTVYKNVELSLKKQKGNLSKTQVCEKVENTIKMVHMEGYENVFPNKLSGGMKQRIALARALVTNPKLLLLDEPFSALDEKTRKSMQEMILSINKEQNTTMIFVTHNIQEALAIGKRIIILNQGRIVLNMENEKKEINTKEYFEQYELLLRSLQDIA